MERVAESEAACRRASGELIHSRRRNGRRTAAALPVPPQTRHHPLPTEDPGRPEPVAWAPPSAADLPSVRPVPQGILLLSHQQRRSSLPRRQTRRTKRTTGPRSKLVTPMLLPPVRDPAAMRNRRARRRTSHLRGTGAPPLSPQPRSLRQTNHRRRQVPVRRRLHRRADRTGARCRTRRRQDGPLRAGV